MASLSKDNSRPQFEERHCEHFVERRRNAIDAGLHAVLQSPTMTLTAFYIAANVSLLELQRHLLADRPQHHRLDARPKDISCRNSACERGPLLAEY